ncbi:MAG: bifunctional diaminohydroxyphosphoribosylaminopyrimidine deaminase/5-amino-6-(5-phosphoribosylamino)uracil reductase RibD [Planctomycetota bacterium]|nr:bifunctional diaminohydroxyphosphoribosylaminopyrimidine deaminase/5-amino-6-(5-phosphoribosylamino)uracil reductase RibD [Planctomycetota bacterium]
MTSTLAIPTRASDLDERMLARAARLAWRAAGDVEPNPLVGCIIGRPRTENDVEILGAGHHRRFGGAHAEIEAIADCERRGASPRGATAWVTLEPCAHTGKTGPCVDALIRAGLARVVVARRDPHPPAAGGFERLRAVGIETAVVPCAAARRLTDPFIKRLETGLPWIIAKWAQSIDGRLATRDGESQWISGPRSRRRVHRLRGRVDAIVTGIGSVLADDPRLTARGLRRIRRTAARIVIDPNLNTPADSALVASISEAPLIIACAADAVEAGEATAQVLRECGAELWTFDRDNGAIDLREVFARLVSDRDATNVLVEAGPGLLGRLFEADLIDEARVFIAPLMFADADAAPVARGRPLGRLRDATRFTVEHVRRLDDDIEIAYRRARESDAR